VRNLTTQRAIAAAGRFRGKGDRHKTRIKKLPLQIGWDNEFNFGGPGQALFEFPKL
jgi:hypothetical protein